MRRGWREALGVPMPEAPELLAVSADPLDKPLEGQDAFFLEQTKKKGVRRPPRLHIKPSPAPAVEVTPAGASYNPTFEDHQVGAGPSPALLGPALLLGHFAVPALCWVALGTRMRPRAL
ncbi:ribosome biogenesis protein NOP53-like [Marmota marmota marmota]|uniref:ribosome biogenesis protein NOP53-like n=1 Tax=Marmota marmota marmota TaxID=9994 RepID=UPI0007629D4C|nr:ribosome biogenesis protein NOP53-like [Marmota marmota marmota]